MTEEMCKHLTVVVRYSIIRYQLEVGCADCEYMLATLTDEELERSPDAALTVIAFADKIGIRQEIVTAALRRGK